MHPDNGAAGLALAAPSTLCHKVRPAFLLVFTADQACYADMGFPPVTLWSTATHFCVLRDPMSRSVEERNKRWGHW